VPALEDELAARLLPRDGTTGSYGRKVAHGEARVLFLPDKLDELRAATP
jgi:hypothetical protein